MVFSWQMWVLGLLARKVKEKSSSLVLPSQEETENISGIVVSYLVCFLSVCSVVISGTTCFFGRITGGGVKPESELHKHCNFRNRMPTDGGGVKMAVFTCYFFKYID